jgi:hypothetical protein
MGIEHVHEHDENEEDEGEISISFAPRYEELTKLGITADQFESALLIALDEFETLSARDDINPDELSLEEVTLHIGGTPHRLGDLADIEIGDEGDEDEEEFEDEDEDDDADD